MLTLSSLCVCSRCVAFSLPFEINAHPVVAVHLQSVCDFLLAFQDQCSHYGRCAPAACAWISHCFSRPVLTPPSLCVCSRCMAFPFCPTIRAHAVVAVHLQEVSQIPYESPRPVLTPSSLCVCSGYVNISFYPKIRAHVVFAVHLQEVSHFSHESLGLVLTQLLLCICSMCVRLSPLLTFDYPLCQNHIQKVCIHPSYSLSFR